MTGQTIAEKTSYCDYIDGLRGIAILMVMAVHTAITCGELQPIYFKMSFSKTLLNSGARGVQLFFILSAFTLFNSSLKRFQVDAYPRIAFYLRRAFRILPFWWIAVVCYGALKRIAIVKAMPSVFFYFGFIRFDAAREIVPGGWSLFVEETFYLLLPFVLYYVTGIGRAVKFLCATVFIAVMWVTFAPRLGVPTSNSFVWLSPLANWFCFALGILSYHLSKQPNWSSLVDQLLPRSLGIDLSLMIVIILGVTSRFTAPTVLFLLVCVSSDPNGLFGQVTRQRWLMQFGRYCYSLYLIHFALLIVLKHVFAYLFKSYIHFPVSMEIRFIAVFIPLMLAGITTGYICFNAVEKPCVDLGKRLVTRINDLKSQNLV